MMKASELEISSKDFAVDGSNANGVARQREVMRNIQRRLVAHLGAGGTTDMADDCMVISSRIYADQELFEIEQKKLFETLPLVAGLSCDIPERGDVMTFDEVGPPIIIVRTASGGVRAFLNRCSHRAARLVGACSHQSRITCPFHGWTFDLEGKLIGLPVKEGFAGLERQNLNLVRVPVREWNGVIFIRARPGDEEIDIESYLGSMAPELAQLGLGRMVPIKKQRVEIGANWKFALDTFFEAYHFATLHAKSIVKETVCNVMVHDEFGPHQRVMVPQLFWKKWIGRPEEEWERVPYQGIHLLFPNTIMLVVNLDFLDEGGGSASDRQIFGFWRMFPGGSPGKGYSQMATYRPDSQKTSEQMAEYVMTTDQIINILSTEDFSLCRDGQRNMETSGKEDAVIIGRNEGAVQSIHEHLAAYIADKPRAVRC
jgi:phenylpropionate dioxygenase-like ring-hydroxylating dioxygenase large terminal subunit